MHNTFSQSGNDSKSLLKNHFSEHPFMEKSILNFDFDYLNPSLHAICRDGTNAKDTYVCLIHMWYMRASIFYVFFFNSVLKWSLFQRISISTKDCEADQIARSWWTLNAVEIKRHPYSLSMIRSEKQATGRQVEKQFR